MTRPATAAELRQSLVNEGWSGAADDPYELRMAPHEIDAVLRRIGQARNAHLDAMQRILDGANRRGSALLASETRQFDRAEAECLALDNLAQEVTMYRTENDDVITYGSRGPHGGNPVQARALEHYLRTGDEAELRAQGVSSGAAGGYLVPPEWRNRIVETLGAFGGLRSVAEVITTDSGADLPFPTHDGTANVGAILAENTQVTEQDVVVGQKTLRAFMYTSKMVRVSLQLLQDSGFDVPGFLARELGQRIGRAQAPHFVTGTGTGQPQGIVTGATVGVIAAAGQTTTVTYDNLVDLVHSVDPAYLDTDQGVGWLMNSTTLASLRKLKDADGRPLIEPDVTRGVPNSLLGYRVIVDQAMPSMAASAKSILFGNLRAGYVIRDVRGVEVARLQERYMDFLQHGFIAWMRSDGMVQDPAAFRSYQNAAA